jgi:low temperature requirement protein LtrA
MLFACAYVGLQIGRNTFVVAVTPRGEFNRIFRHILAWSVLSAPLWVAGCARSRSGGAARDLLAAGGRSHAREPLAIEGAHFGERFQLFVIIALGESVVLAGATASDTGSAATSTPTCTSRSSPGSSSSRLAMSS